MITPRLALVLNAIFTVSIFGGIIFLIWDYIKMRKKVNKLYNERMTKRGSDPHNI
jgi:hypothetical protein